MHDEQPTDGTAASPAELHVADSGGVWVVRSASATAYFIDIDRGVMLRAPGENSTLGGWDGCWVPLVRVASEEGGDGVLRVGERHLWLTDPNRAWRDHRRWIQRRCTSIESVPAAQVPVGREATANDPWVVDFLALRRRP